MTKTLTGNVSTEKAKDSYNPVWLVEFAASDGTTYRYATHAIAAADWDPAGDVYKDGLIKGEIGAVKQSLPDMFGLAITSGWEFSIDNKESTRFCDAFSSKYFSNQTVTLSLLFDDGTKYTDADVVKMGSFTISDVIWDWNKVTFKCNDIAFSKLQSPDTTTIGPIGQPLAPQDEWGRIIPITYGSVSWAEGVLYERGGGYNKVYFNDATTYSIDDVGIYDQETKKYIGINSGVYAPITTYTPRGVIDFKVIGNTFYGSIDISPDGVWSYDTNDDQPAFYAIDGRKVTFAEIPMFTSTQEIEFDFKLPLFEEINTVNAYAYITLHPYTADPNNAIQLVMYSNVEDDAYWGGVNLIYGTSGLSGRDNSYNSLYGSDDSFTMTGYYRRARKLGYDIDKHLVRSLGQQRGALRVHEYRTTVKGTRTLVDGEKFYGRIKGSEYGAWIGAPGRSSGHSQGDLIQTPPYIFEHSLRKLFSFTTSNLYTTSFDIAGNTIDGILKDFECAGQIVSEIEDTREFYNEMLKQFSSFAFVNYDGKIVYKAFDPTASAYGTTISQTHIIKDTIKYELEPLENVYSKFKVYYNWDPATSSYKNVAHVGPNSNNIYSPSVQNACLNALTNNNSHNSYTLPARFHRDSDTVRDLIINLATWHTTRFTKVTFRAPLDFIDVELVDFLNIDHPIASDAGISSSDNMMVNEINLLPAINQIEITVVGPIPDVISATNSFLITQPGYASRTGWGGKQLYIDNEYPIIWLWEGTMDFARLHYSPDAGSSWSAISSKTNNDGRYDWTVPAGAVTTDGRLRISGTPDTSFENSVDIVVLATNSASQDIVVYEPTSNTIWDAGSVGVIRWTSGFITPVTNVDIDYYDGADWNTIEDDVTNVGYYSWRVPDFLATDNDYKVRVTDSDDAGDSDESAEFTIVQGDAPSTPSISSSDLLVTRRYDGLDEFDEYLYEKVSLLLTFTDTSRDDSKFRKYEITVVENSQDPEAGDILNFNPKIASSYTYESAKGLGAVTNPAEETYKVCIRAVNETDNGTFRSNWDTRTLDIIYSGEMPSYRYPVGEIQDGLIEFSGRRTMFAGDRRGAGRGVGAAEVEGDRNIGDVIIGTGDKRITARSIIDLNSTADPVLKTAVEEEEVIVISDGAPHLGSDVTQSDGVSQKAITKGHISGQGTNGEDITFITAFQNTPVVFMRGGITYEPRPGKWKDPSLGSGWATLDFSTSFDADKPQYEERSAVDTTTSGFKIQARLRQKGTVVQESETFKAGTIAAAGNSIECTIDPGVAADNTYSVTYGITTSDCSEENSLRTQIAIDSNDGGGWVQRRVDTFIYTEDVLSETHQYDVVVSGIGANDHVRVRIQTLVAVGGSSISVDPSTTIYTTVTSGVTADMTPLQTGDFISWEAFEVS